MPKAIACMQKMLKEERSKDVYNTFVKFNQVLGLNMDNLVENNIPDEIKHLAEKRWNAKKNRDFAKADDLRNQLLSLGYEIKDNKDGFEILKK